MSGDKKIVITCVVIFLLGMVSVFLPPVVSQMPGPDGVPMWVNDQYWNTVLGAVHLLTFDEWLLVHYNYFNLTFYVLLLAGAAGYLWRKNYAAYLLRCCFLLIFMNNALLLLRSSVNEILYISKNIQTFKPDRFLYDFLITSIIKTAWLVLSFHAFRYLQQNRVLHINHSIAEGVTQHYYTVAGRFSRVIHWLLDAAFCTTMMAFYFYGFCRHHPDALAALGERTMLYLFVTAWLLVYYGIAEMLFATSPAKCLTGSRVALYNGGKPGVWRILARTLLRAFPAEPLLFACTLDPHDRWSHTFVLREKDRPVDNGTDANDRQD